MGTNPNPIGYSARMALDDYREQYLETLGYAESWLERIASDPIAQRQDVYGVCFKLSANWQRFVKDQADADGVPTRSMGNCQPGRVEAAYEHAGCPSPFLNVTCPTDFLDDLNRERNAIAHGDDPQMPSAMQLRQWIASLRALGHQYAR